MSDGMLHILDFMLNDAWDSDTRFIFLEEDWRPHTEDVMDPLSAKDVIQSYNAWCKLLLPLLVMAWETLFGCPGNSIRKLGCAPRMAIWLRSTRCLSQGTFVTTRRTQTQRVRIGTRFSCDICGRNLVSWALASVNHLWGAIIHIYQVVKTTWPIKSENVIGALAGELS